MIEGRIRGEALLHDCKSSRRVIRERAQRTVIGGGEEID